MFDRVEREKAGNAIKIQLGKLFFLLKMPSDSLNCNAIKNEMVKVQRAETAEWYK